MKNISKITLIFVFLFFAFTANTCEREDENHHKTILFANYYNKSIYVIGSVEYPDTLNAQGMGGGGLSYPKFYKIYPNTENKNALLRQEFYEDIFRNGGQIPSDTLMIYVFDAELLETPSIHINNAIIQRYDLSLQDLQYVNWTLTYPPLPNMSAIKMYPPYGQ